MIGIERNTMAGAVILLSVAVGFAPLAVKETSLEKVRVEFNSSADISSSDADNLTDLGINAGEHLEFGEIQQNANYTKWINVGVDTRSRVEIETRGNISTLLRHKDIVYVKGQSRIPVELFPHSTGYYEGKVVLTVWRPKNSLGELYLEAWRRVESVA